MRPLRVDRVQRVARLAEEVVDLAAQEAEGDERPDAWPLDEGLAAVGDRWGIDPASDLVVTR